MSNLWHSATFSLLCKVFRAIAVCAKELLFVRHILVLIAVGTVMKWREGCSCRTNLLQRSSAQCSCSHPWSSPCTLCRMCHAKTTNSPLSSCHLCLAPELCYGVAVEIKIVSTLLIHGSTSSSVSLVLIYSLHSLSLRLFIPQQTLAKQSLKLLGQTTEHVECTVAPLF